MRSNELETKRAPALEADALWDAVEDALISASLDAAAAVAQETARLKGRAPVARKTKARRRAMVRKVLSADQALVAITELRRRASEPVRDGRQMQLPLRVNGNGATAHHAY